MSLTEAQKEQRLNYVTGSDASIICGLSPWGNIIDLWQEKLRLKAQEDISDKPGVKAGIYLEEGVANWFADETNKKLSKSEEMLIHKSIPWMAGNIDRWVENESAILECKTSSREDGWGELGENKIPDYYLTQVAHYSAVCDVERAYIAVLIRGNDFRWYCYERNEKLEELIIKREKEFWDCVQNESPPTPRTPEEVISLYSVATQEESILASEAIQESLKLLKSHKETIKVLEAQQKTLEANIKAYMKTYSSLKDENDKVLATWNNARGAMRFDAKRFAEEHRDLYEQYLTQSVSSRRFIIK